MGRAMAQARLIAAVAEPIAETGGGERPAEGRLQEGKIAGIARGARRAQGAGELG
jgi:hypothetical protein